MVLVQGCEQSLTLPPSSSSSWLSPCWPGEVTKLQQHLDLLRDQYVKLQQKHAELEQKYTSAVATSGNAGTDHFVSRLLKLVAELFDKPLYRYVWDIALSLSLILCLRYSMHLLQLLKNLLVDIWSNYLVLILFRVHHLVMYTYLL